MVDWLIYGILGAIELALAGSYWIRGMLPAPVCILFIVLIVLSLTRDLSRDWRSVRSRLLKR
jgi:hypothetical protein